MPVVNVSDIRDTIACPYCGEPLKRHSIGKRYIRDLNDTLIVNTYSKHRCLYCKKFISVLSEGNLKHSYYSRAVKLLALKLLEKENYTLAKTAAFFKSVHNLDIPTSTMHDWLAEC